MSRQDESVLSCSLNANLEMTEPEQDSSDEQDGGGFDSGSENEGAGKEEEVVQRGPSGPRPSSPSTPAVEVSVEKLFSPEPRAVRQRHRVADSHTATAADDIGGAQEDTGGDKTAAAFVALCSRVQHRKCELCRWSSKDSQ